MNYMLCRIPFPCPSGLVSFYQHGRAFAHTRGAAHSDRGVRSECPHAAAPPRAGRRITGYGRGSGHELANRLRRAVADERFLDNTWTEAIFIPGLPIAVPRAEAEGRKKDMGVATGSAGRMDRVWEVDKEARVHGRRIPWCAWRLWLRVGGCPRPMRAQRVPLASDRQVRERRKMGAV